MTTATGGSLRAQFDPKRWAADARQLLSQASPTRLNQAPTSATFINDLAAVPARPVSPWNRTWLKSAAVELARSAAPAAEPLAARWPVGGGEVIALAFPPTPAEIDAAARLIARPPRDPRYAVTWDAGPRLRVRIDAIDGGKYLNDQPFRLSIAPEDNPVAPVVHPIPQTAPGRYELAIDAPRARAFATVRLGDRTVDTIPVAARYAPEFDAIGNDYDAMRTLANRTGGKVIDPAWQKPVDITFPRRDLELSPWLALAAACALALGLTRWRLG
jgi:hypothetical protein